MAETLPSRDLRTVLDVARTIGETDGLDAYRASVLELAPRLVAGEVYGYNEVPPRRGQPLIEMSSYPSEQVWWDSLVRLGTEHPTVLHVIATGDPDARAISDLVSRRDFESSEFYRDVLAYVSGRDQLAVSIPGSDGLVIGLAVNRARRGFSARDHAMYDAIRPFLLQGYRNAVERDRARLLMQALGTAADAVDQPVVLVGHGDRIEHLTPGAAELLERLGMMATGRLNGPLGGWLREQRARAVPVPLRINGCTARLVREAAPGYDAIALTVSERSLSVRALRAIGLTRREAEVMALVAAGASNAEVARRLGIADATVAKHLQHVNEKLGVPSRTAAVARARELVTGLD